MESSFELSLQTNHPGGFYKILVDGNESGQELFSILDIKNIVSDPVISIKGWGSGITKYDLNKFKENYLEKLKSVFTNKNYWIQWDGDNIDFGNYTQFILEIVQAFSGNIKGFISIKQKKEKDIEMIRNDFPWYLNKTGLNKLLPFRKVMLIGVAPLEEHPANKESGYAIWGACLSKIFKPVYTIYFGGGDVVNKEYKNELFIKETKMIFFDIKRKAGTESSTLENYVSTFKQTGVLGFGKQRGKSPEIKYLFTLIK
jgi:hypothetical protein